MPPPSPPTHTHTLHPQVSNGADHTAVSLQRGGVVAFGRGHKGQLTGGLRGPGTAKPFFSWALSKGNPVAVKAEGDCTCVLYRPAHSADLLESSKNGRAMLGGNVRGRQFGNPAFRCHGDCGELLQKLEAAMELAVPAPAPGAPSPQPLHATAT